MSSDPVPVAGQDSNPPAGARTTAPPEPAEPAESGGSAEASNATAPGQPDGESNVEDGGPSAGESNPAPVPPAEDSNSVAAPTAERGEPGSSADAADSADATRAGAQGFEPGADTPEAGESVPRETPPPVRPAFLPRADSETPIAAAAAAAVVFQRGVAPPLPRPAVTRQVTIANQKGGVGKTTTAVNVAAALSLQGLRVLLLDLDPQGNASTALDVPHHAGVPSIYEALVDAMPLREIVVPANGLGELTCAPATIDLAGAEIELASVVARESRLKRMLSAYVEEEAAAGRRLDYVLIDCPPSLGLLTVNALVAADEVLIPIQCEYYALEGLGQLLRNVELVRAHLNEQLAVSTILLTMYDGRTRLAEQVAAEVREHFGDVVLRAVVPRSVRLSEAPSYGQSIMTYDPGSPGALAYIEAAHEFAMRALDTAPAADAATPPDDAAPSASPMPPVPPRAEPNDDVGGHG
jgi:chromosome partitioning protein